MFSLFRLCRTYEISFDFVAETGKIVTKNGNNVEAAFDIVEIIVNVTQDSARFKRMLMYAKHMQENGEC